jgi:hypothetical protein
MFFEVKSCHLIDAKRFCEEFFIGIGQNEVNGPQWHGQSGRDGDQSSIKHGF